MHSPIQTTSPPFYVSGAMMMLVFLLFCNSRQLALVNVESLGEPGLQEMIIDDNAQKNMMNSILACSIGGLALLFLRNRYFTQDNGQKFGCFYLCNSMLAGVISVSACIDSLESETSIIVALAGSALYFVISKLYLKYEIDDPLESSIIYGWMTFYSSIVVGFVDKEKGLFNTGTFDQLKVQCTGVFSIIAFTTLTTFILVLILRKHRRFKFGQIFEVVGHNNLISEAEHKLLSNHLLAKIELKQREGNDTNKKSRRS